MSMLLAELASEYRLWSEQVVRRVRHANELDQTDDASVDRANGAIMEARTKREAAAEKYIEESEKQRTMCCRHDPEDLIVTCAACVRLYGGRPTQGVSHGR